MQIPQIKSYEIDYQFIIDNYTNPKLWGKIWNLFVFKKYVYTITMSSIDVKKFRINFEIKLDSNLDVYEHSKSGIVSYDIKNSTLKILKQQINGMMFNLAEALEREVIYDSEEYLKIRNSKDIERDYLRDIATEFLDEEGITNDDIREAYIDYYVDKNETIYQQLGELEDKMKFNKLTELFLILTECSNDFDRKQLVIENQNDELEFQTILQEVNEFVEQLETEEYKEEMISNLEAI